MIAISLITFFLLIAIVIAVLLYCIRRKLTYYIAIRNVLSLYGMFYIPVIAISLITFFLLIAIVIAVLLYCIRRKQTYYIKHLKYNHYQGDYEMKQPLNASGHVPSPPRRPQSAHMPLATFDEFSMVSATLGRKYEWCYATTKSAWIPMFLNAIYVLCTKKVHKLSKNHES